jgi:hypothetical protein
VNLNKNKTRIIASICLVVLCAIAIFSPAFTFGANIYSFLVILVVVSLVLLLYGITRLNESEKE